MKKEAKMLPIRSEDSLTIPLHNLSQEKQRPFQIERKISQNRKLTRQELSAVFFCNNPCCFFQQAYESYSVISPILKCRNWGPNNLHKVTERERVETDFKQEVWLQTKTGLLPINRYAI